MSMILFSKPSPLSFEKGKLFGSAQTLSSPATAVVGGVSSKRTSRLARKAEHKEGPSFAGDILEVAHGVDKAQRRAAISWIEITGNNSTRPSAYPREDRDILMSVRSPIGRWLADNPRACLELPK